MLNKTNLPLHDVYVLCEYKGAAWNSIIINISYLCTTLGAVAEFVECMPGVWKVGSSVPSRVKPTTYQIDTCHFLA